MDCMSNVCEYAGTSNALFNTGTAHDHAQVAVWGAYVQINPRTANGVI